jgi:hypothetical protein
MKVSRSGFQTIIVVLVAIVALGALGYFFVANF